MPSSSATRKRKHDDEMEETPPKRVTRARTAKAAAESTKDVKLTKITPGSIKAVAAAKAAPKVNRTTTKRKAVDEATEDHSTDELERIEKSVPDKRPRGRPKKETGKTENQEPTNIKSQTAKNVNTASQRLTQPTAATAARTRNTTVKATMSSGAKDVSTMKSARQTSKETASTKDTTETNRREMKKKVMFDDETTQNKENLPLKPKSKVSTSKDTTSKPSTSRKTSSARSASTKSSAAKIKAATTKKGQMLAAKKEADSKAAASSASVPPLSPKKVTQVAKSVSSGSEDELCDKPLSRALSRSPKKDPVSVRSVIKVAPKAKAVCPTSPNSPSKGADTGALRSPAKRPPPSPFKDSIRNSPLKFNISKPEITASEHSTSLFQHSLKASPKKINLALSEPTEPGLASKSSLETSLLKSPAKRPCSPERIQLFTSSSKSPLKGCVSKTPGPTEENTFKLPTITPKRLFLSPRPEAKSSPRNLDGNLNGVPRNHKSESPAKVAFVQYKANPLAAYNEELARQGKLPGLQTPSYRVNREDFDSDDENLTSPSKMNDNSTPTFIFKTQDGTTHRRETMGITPLALKMSTWYASSPEKQFTSEENEPGSSPTHPPLDEKEVSIIRSLEATPTKESYFEVEMADHENEHRPENLDTHDMTRDLHLSGMSNTHLVVEPQGHGEDEQTEDIPNVSKANMQAITRYNADASISEVLSLHETPSKGNVEFMPIRESLGPSSIEKYNKSLQIDSSRSTEGIRGNQDHEVFGNENELPIDPVLLDRNAQKVEVAAASFQDSIIGATPPQTAFTRHREIHTVCKVPLRTEGPEESPIRINRKRSKSTNAPLGELHDLVQTSTPVTNDPGSEATSVAERQIAASGSPRKVSYETSIINELMTPKAGPRSVVTSPTKSTRTGQDAKILRGAVVFVDVHTTEGADASSIFVELLTQMGARCVKQWTWKPRHSQATSSDRTPLGKVGITHVVFKDGGKRTLQKVRDAKGLVLCVGVSWVLDCERENNWLDEALYAVDTSTIPRGGHNRRKSMEPKMLANNHGTLVPAETPSKSSYAVSSPTSEFRAFSAKSRRSSIRESLGSDVEEARQDLQAPSTPLPYVPDGDELCDLTNLGSPTTPYYLSRGAELVQQTCPPKTTGELLFPVSGRIEDHPDENMRQRLLMARRKSLQWAPKIKSPLGRAVSYGK